MLINVKAKTRAKNEDVEKVDENNFVVSIKEPPEKGKANFAIERALAQYFKTPIYNVKLVSGFSSRNKIFEIDI